MQFIKDINEGLSKKNKTLPSRYFYDEIGDKLFVEIMNMPEYYLTKSEHEIFKTQTKEIVSALGIDKNEPIEIVELGAGDGTKTKEILRFMLRNNYTFSYLPVDISQHALDGLENALKEEFKSLDVKTQQGDYFEVLDNLKNSPRKKIVLFLGSNLGNLEDKDAIKFMSNLSRNLNKGDKLLLGVDIIKSADIVLPAYDDKQKITARFNLNLLHRINKELGANFDVNNFKHQPEYTMEEGIAKSFLVSNKTQDVTIPKINKTYSFKAGEKIHTEISRKYNDKILNEIITISKFKIATKFVDSKNYFADYILDIN